MSKLTGVITASDLETRNQSLDALCHGATLEELLGECEALDGFRRSSDNLYERVRALFFLYAIHRFHIPLRPEAGMRAPIPFAGYVNLLKRRFEEAIDIFLAAQTANGPSAAISSALAAGYRALGFQTLADQVRRSVRSVRGNQWMFRTGHPADYPLRVRPELLACEAAQPLFPILREATPVRMDLTHSGWSDIFFLGMDFPEGARVLNISIDLSVRGAGGQAAPPAPPVEAYFRVIDQPVLRLVSVDLKASAEIGTIAEVFDFARDYLGLLKAAVIASGIVPPGMEGATQPLADVLARLTGRPGHGIEIVSKVNDIPKGSRLAVSTSLLACLIAVCMRATSQIHALTGGLEEHDRRLVAARAILGEWLAGSGGGWQDSGGVWPGIKLIHGVCAQEGDPEFGISRGRLLPDHKIFSLAEVPQQTREKLQQSLVLVHGGMAQDVGPILEMVTEKYLLRSETEWRGRQEAIGILDEVMGHLKEGDVEAIGGCTQRNFDGPIQTIIPWAGNLYTDTLIRRVRAEMGEDFWGFWMLGGMSGGGMGFLFSPQRKAFAQERLGAIMSETKRRGGARHPVRHGAGGIQFRHQRARHRGGAFSRRRARSCPPTTTRWPCLRCCARNRACFRPCAARSWTGSRRRAARWRNSPAWWSTSSTTCCRAARRRKPTGRRASKGFWKHTGSTACSTSRSKPTCAAAASAWRRTAFRRAAGIEDAGPDDLLDATHGLAGHYRETGMDALAAGAVAVVSLAGGVGSRWTKGAGVVKALNPFSKLGGRHRSFIEVHLAKSLRVGRASGVMPAHVITTSYLTHDAIEAHMRAVEHYGYPGPLLLSPGRSIGLRLVPMERDLRFAWEEMPQQLLDEQAQKVRESLHATLIAWAGQMGEGGNYTDNLPMQCLHPVGHWYEVPNLLRNGTLLRLLEERPRAEAPDGPQHRHRGGGPGRGAPRIPYRGRRGADHGGDRAPHRGPRRRPGARGRPRAPGGGPGAAQRRDRIAAFLLQQRHLLGRYRPTTGGVRT